MKINPINILYFNGKREDHNYVKKLSQNTIPINENLHDNIVNALDSLSHDASVENIRFLLNTAKHLEYGTRENSDFRKKVLINSPLTDKQPLSNEDWEEKLKTATRHAMDIQPHLPEYLKRKFSKVFKKPLNLSADEKSILDLKTKFLQTKIIVENVTREPDIVSNIRKNLDYFLLSSEISTTDKKKCMELLSNFASHNYKINPQLKDKKLQVLNEILNDIIIKTPEAETLTIKAVDQKRHGMCAAIAASRKLLAYQDKVNYLSNIFEELSASPYMKIYDITQLGTGKKIPVRKADINFNDAIKRGYRIIDASALQWMYNASRVGNSSDITQEYLPFDENNYEIFKDSFWLSKYPESLNGIHCLLISIIKAKDFASDVEKNLLREKISNENAKAKENKNIDNIRYNKDMLIAELSELLPQKQQREIISFANKLLSLYDSRKYVVGGNYKKESPENEKYLVNPREALIIQRNKLSAFIKNNTNVSEEEINKHIDKIYQFFISTNDYIQSEVSNKKSLTAQMADYEDLFNFACAYRRTMEAYTNDPENIMYSGIATDIPCRMDIISQHLNMLSKSVKNATPEAISGLAKALKLPADGEIISNKISELNKEFQKTINSQINQICSLSGMKNIANLLITVLDVQSEIVSKNKKYAAALGETLGVKPFAYNVNKRISSLKEALQKEPTEENIEKTLKALQIKDRLLFVTNIANSIDLILNNQFQGEYIQQEQFLLLRRIINNNPDKNKLLENVNISKHITMLMKQSMDNIENMFAIPTLQELALKKLEDIHEILTEEELNTLEKRFLALTQFRNLKDEATLNNEKINGYSLYQLTDNEKRSLKKIKAGFYQAKSNLTRMYNDINKTYADEIDEIYRKTGREKGDFWISEEGSSGLSAHEQLKILEQMTGKPYHIEKDLSKAIQYIKSGKGGGEIGVNVDDNRFAGHAMFVPSVTKETFLNLKTGEKEEKDVIWHDNSWGNIERNNVWTDDSGITRTDYHNGTGGKQGFIVRNNGMIGWRSEYMMYGSGINKPEYIDNPREAKLHKHIGVNFPIFHDIVLEGRKSTDINSKIVTDIFGTSTSKIMLDTLISKIKNGEYPDIQKYGKAMDKYVSSHEAQLLEGMKQIKSEEEFNSLPDNDERKIILNKVALRYALFGSANQSYIDDIVSMDGIHQYKTVLLEKLKHFLLGYLEQNSSLLNTMALKSKYYECLDTIPKKYEDEIEKLTKGLANSLKIPAKAITKERPLKTIFLKNVGDVVDKNIKDKELAEKLKAKLLKISEKYYLETYSTDALLKNKDYAAFLTFIDKKFDPASDEAAKQILEKLKHSSQYAITNLLHNISLQDFGVEFGKPYHYLKEILAHNYNTTDKLSNTASAHYANLYMPVYNGGKVALGTTFSPKSSSTSDSVNAYYRNLYIELSYTGLDKFIKAQKEEALREYSVRESFPMTKSYNEEVMQDNIRDGMLNITNMCRRYGVNNNLIKFTNNIRYLYKNINENSFMSKEVFQEHILPILQEIKENKNISMLNAAMQKILNGAGEDDYKITIKLLKQEYKSLRSFIKKSDIDKIKTNQQKLIQNIHSYLREFSEINIADSKKCDTLKNLIKNFIRAVMQNSSEPVLEEHISNIQDFMIKNTAYSEPEHLLNKLIELLKDKTEKEKNNIAVDKSTQNIINECKEILVSLLYSSNINQAEYKIIEAINSGEIYNFRKDIKNCNISTENNKSMKLNSKEGLRTLFSVLYNSNEKEKATETLNLLCKQTGLADDIYKALKENITPDVAQKDLEMSKKLLTGFQKDADIIKKIPLHYEQFDDYTDFIKQYIENLDKQFETNKNSDTYTLYKKIFGSFSNALNPVIEQIKIAMPEEYAAKKHSIFQQAFEYQQAKSINFVLGKLLDKIDLNNKSDALQIDINMLEKLPINEYSECYKEVQQTRKLMKKVLEYSYRRITFANEIYDKFYNENAEQNNLNISLE